MRRCRDCDYSQTDAEGELVSCTLSCSCWQNRDSVENKCRAFSDIAHQHALNRVLSYEEGQRETEYLNERRSAGNAQWQ